MEFIQQIDLEETERRKLLEVTDQLIDVIKETQIYKRYRIQCEKVEKQPEIKEKMDEYRTKNFNLQNSSFEGEEMQNHLEALQREYESVLKNPLVADFLTAELDFCRLMQFVNLKMADAMDFE